MGAIGYLPPEQAFRKAEHHAKRALELEETAGEAHTAMAAVQLFYHWDWEGAYRSFQKALSLTPGSAEAHQLYGMYLRALGEIEESLDELRTAVALDPLAFGIRDELAKTLAVAGKLDEAEAELNSILLADPSFRAATETLGWVQIARGDAEAALAIFDTLPQMAGHRFASASSRGYVLAILGRTDEAREMLALLEQRQVENPELAMSIDFALVYQGFGDFDKVFHYLDQVADQRMGAMVFLASNVFWGDEIRKDPRFDALLERIGHPTRVGTRVGV
jgi:Tfp pilus assembly protein PilF